jgi:flagellar protein FlgJ
MKLAFDPKMSMPAAAPGNEKNRDDKDPEALKELCRDFESVFIHTLFKEMRKTIPESELLGNDMASDLFEEIMDMEVARDMASKGGFGLADMLYRQLQPPDESQ